LFGADHCISVTMFSSIINQTGPGNGSVQTSADAMAIAAMRAHPFVGGWHPWHRWLQNQLTLDSFTTDLLARTSPGPVVCPSVAVFDHHKQYHGLGISSLLHASSGLPIFIRHTQSLLPTNFMPDHYRLSNYDPSISSQGQVHTSFPSNFFHPTQSKLPTSIDGLTHGQQKQLASHVGDPSLEFLPPAGKGLGVKSEETTNEDLPQVNKGRCEHKTRKTRCKICGGGSLCQHNEIKSYCKLCHGTSICEHNRRRHRCKWCHGSTICSHGVERTRCKVQLCRDSCKTRVCLHLREKSRCRDCFFSNNLHKCNMDHHLFDGAKQPEANPMFDKEGLICHALAHKYSKLSKRHIVPKNTDERMTEKCRLYSDVLQGNEDLNARPAWKTKFLDDAPPMINKDSLDLSIFVDNSENAGKSCLEATMVYMAY